LTRPIMAKSVEFSSLFNVIVDSKAH
jgi:hypothetical protein